MTLQKINGRYYVGRAGVSYNNLKSAFEYIAFCLRYERCNGKHENVPAILACKECAENLEYMSPTVRKLTVKHL